MGVAALVLGIVSIIFAWIPFCGTIAFIPAIIGLILGIIDTVQKSKKGEKKGVSIAGIILSAIAIAFITIYTIAIGSAAQKAAEALNNINTNEIINSINFNSIFSNMTIE